MSGGYVLCEYDKVKEYFPEFNAMMEALEATLVAKARADWSPLKFTPPGIYPKSGEFGKTTVMPELFQGGIFPTGTPLTTLTDWNAYIGSAMTVPGHNTLLQGSASSAMIFEDYMIGLAGIAFLDKVQRVSEIKMQVGDRKLPRINVEECMAYNKPAIIFEDGYVLDEEESFHLYGYALSHGPLRLKLLGLQLHRVPNKLQTTNTGAAIT